MDISNREFVGTCEIMKDNLVNGVYVLLTNANNVAVFLVQFRVIQKLFSTMRDECKVKFA